MKRFLAIAAVLLVCSACAQGGAGSGAGSGSISMYGTVDEGISFRR